MSAALDHFAARLDADPAFLGHYLARWCQMNGEQWAEFGEWLGVTPDDLTRLRLCRAPRPTHRAADIAAIAARFGCDADTLAAVLADVGN